MVAPALRCSFQPGIVECLGHCELLYCHGHANMGCLTTTLAFSHALNKAKTPLFFVSMVNDFLTL